ncbi:MAG: hypothetical protein GXO87_00345 [Chlorobi bacterium]|nr:hypothetical protein [Chlorobiota bacterium]
MELIPIIKQALYIVTALFVVTVIVSYIASKFKKPKKEISPPAIKPKAVAPKTSGALKTKAKTAVNNKTGTSVTKTKTSESKSGKINPEEIKLPPNVVRKKSSRRKERKTTEPKTQNVKKKNREPRFEVVKDLKKAGKKFNDGNNNNDIEFR